MIETVGAFNGVEHISSRVVSRSAGLVTNAFCPEGQDRLSIAAL
jgi:hypothetical protein